MKHGRFSKVLVLVVALGSTSRAQLTRRVNLSSAGAQANGLSDYAAISGDGRFVTFRSFASNLTSPPTNGLRDVYTRALLSAQTEIVSVDSNEDLGNAGCGPAVMSADGRYVAFASDATDLVPGDTNGQTDIFIRDRVAGTTQRMSISSGGQQGNALSGWPAISADGNHVAFKSSANNLVPNDSNGGDDIFVRNRLSGNTERVSIDGAELQSNASSDSPSISQDGRFIAFSSGATNLVSGDTNGAWDIFLRDRLTGHTERINLYFGTQGNGHSFFPSITADGHAVAFLSYSTNFVGSGDTNGAPDIFYRILTEPPIVIVSALPNGHPGNGASGAPTVSPGGRHVVFESLATDLVPGDTNGVQDVFVRDVWYATTERMSISSSGVEGNGSSAWPSISADGRFVAFESLASNLVPGDTNGTMDIFLRDRNAAGFTNLCHVGFKGVQTCPCSNPPSVAGRGCNNSSNTGGAFLTASGAAYLSMDSLVFTTFAEKPSALSIVLQGTAFVGSGLVYGQGVRCVGGSLKRLYTQSASGGSITAPNLGGGDPTVSARSAAMGAPIQPGQNRWYLVYYRDPTVLGGCPASSTFNATQTGMVTWGL